MTHKILLLVTLNDYVFEVGDLNVVSINQLSDVEFIVHYGDGRITLVPYHAIDHYNDTGLGNSTKEVDSESPEL